MKELLYNVFTTNHEILTRYPDLVIGMLTGVWELKLRSGNAYHSFYDVGEYTVKGFKAHFYIEIDICGIAMFKIDIIKANGVNDNCSILIRQ